MSGERRLAVVQAGVFLALACIFEYITLFIPRMPQGGKIISLGMVPLVVFAVLCGWRLGILAGIAFGLLFYQIDPFFINPVQFVLDYPVAFGVAGFAGIASVKSGKLKIYGAIILACFLRFLSHFLSGIIFFKAFIPASVNPWIYSLVYNGSFMLPTLAICCIVVPPLLSRLAGKCLCVNFK